MVQWLCDVFGLEEHLGFEDGHGGIAQAQLTDGGSMIMLNSARDDEFGWLRMFTPVGLTWTIR